MKIKFMVLSFLLGLLFIFSGCSMNALQVTNLMKPPKLTGDKAEIQKAVEEVTGSNVILKYPQHGDYRSAIIMRDISGDGKEEAIVFYSTENNSEIYIMILSENSGTWKCVGNFKSRGIDIDKIIFADINNDGIEEIVLGWGTYNNAGTYVSVYYYNKGEYRDIEIDETCTEFIVSDINGDKSNEILLLSLSVYPNPAKAQLVKVNTSESSTNIISVVEMDSEVVKYISVKYGSIDENTKGVFIDSMRSGDTLSTEIIYWDKNKKALVNPLYKNGANFYDSISDNMQIGSRDVDSDGIIEIPKLTYGLGKFTETPNRESSIVICWVKYIIANESMSITKITASDYDDYVFTVPVEWYGKVDIKKEKETNSLVFSEIVGNSSDNSKLSGVDILKIITLSGDDLRRLDSEKEGLIILENQGDKCYVALIPEKGSNLAISEDQVKERFELINKNN